MILDRRKSKKDKYTLKINYIYIYVASELLVILLGVKTDKKTKF